MTSAAPAILVILSLALAGVYLYRARTRAGGATVGESLVGAVLAAVVVTSFSAFILLQLSRFRLTYLLAALGGALVVAAVFAFRTKRGAGLRGADEPRISRAAWALPIVLAVALLLRLPPSLWVHGGQDQGVYLAMSQHIIRTGGIPITDPVLKEAFTGHDLRAQALYTVFAPPLPGKAGDKRRRCQQLSGCSTEDTPQRVPQRLEGTRLPGFYIADKETGRIVPQFFHLHPIWLALFSLVGGFTASVYMLPVFSLLSIATIYYLARRAFNSDWAGLLAAGFLTVNILQVWTNRFPVAETLAQSFLFGGLLFYYRWREQDDPLELWLAAGCFGLFSLTHITGILFLPAFVAAFWLADSSRREYLFYNLIFGLNLYAAAQAVYYNFPYVYDQLLGKGHLKVVPEWYHVVAIGAALIIAANLVKLGMAHSLSGRLWRGLERRRGVVFLVAALLPLAFWGYQSAAVFISAVYGVVAGMNMIDPWIRLTQVIRYVTLPGFALASYGGYRFIVRRFPERPALLPLVGIAAIANGFLASPLIAYQFYYGRYYVIGILPFVLIFAGLGAVRLWEERPRWSRALAGAAVGLMLLAFIVPYFTNPVYRLQEQRGAYATLAAMGKFLSAGSLTFVGSDENYSDHSFHVRYATGLTMISDRYVLPHADLATIGSVARQLAETGQEVRLIVASRPIKEQTIDGGAALEPVGSGREDLAYSEHALDLPRSILQIHDNWYVYRFRAEPGRELPIVIYPKSRIAAVSGFYEPERKTAWAWTNGEAKIEGVAVAAVGRPLSLTISLSGNFPEAINPRIRVEVNGAQLLDREFTGAELRQRRQIGPLEVPARLNRGKLEVVLRSDTWSPAKVGLDRADQRELGVDVTEVVVRVK